MTAVQRFNILATIPFYSLLLLSFLFSSSGIELRSLLHEASALTVDAEPESELFFLFPENSRIGDRHTRSGNTVLFKRREKLHFQKRDSLVSIELLLQCLHWCSSVYQWQHWSRERAAVPRKALKDSFEMSFFFFETSGAISRSGYIQWNLFFDFA